MVSVLIVTWNSARFLDECLASLEQQDYRDLEVIVVDNASTDGTRELLRPCEARWRVIYNQTNVGFAAGQNQAMRAGAGRMASVPESRRAAVGRISSVASLRRDRRIRRPARSAASCLRWNPDAHRAADTGHRLHRNLLHAQHAASRSRRRRDRRAASTIACSTSSAPPAQR